MQSTLILSRKDGSIIQCTGLLAQVTAASHPAPNTTFPADVNLPSQSSESSPAPPIPSTPSIYQPSQAEALAAHIFTFLSSASALGLSLSRPTAKQNDDSQITNGFEGGYDSYGNGTSASREEDRDDDSSDREEEDAVKLLRMRTRKHEIVVVPDRKYLLCVVHDAAHASAGTGALGARSSR